MDQIKATLLIHHGIIRTMEDRSRRVESIAAIGDRIIAAGSNKDLTSLIGPSTEVIDLEGRVVLPGLIDAHEHFSVFSEIPLQLDLSPSKVNSVSKMLDTIAYEAKRLPPGEWIRGRGYDTTKLSEGRMPTRAELDAVAPHHPVILVHVSAHLAVAN
jgi:predicted amidohydrolase YtcJ